MAFVKITIEEYVPLFVASNRGARSEDVRKRLQQALSAFKAGKRCACGERIWVIGSAEAGHACFTCITGEAYPDNDYELAEAIR
jgi:hypothetical protein